MTPEIEKHLSASAKMSKKQIMTNNFLGGLAWGFGTVIGATIVVGILIWILGLFNFVPIINDFLQSENVKGVSNLRK